MYISKYVIFAPCGDNDTVLINSLTGAIDLVPNDLAKRMERFSPGADLLDGVPEDDLRVLRDRGHVFEDELEERGLFLEIKDSYGKLAVSEQFTFWICPTYLCNLDCYYCFEGKSRLATEAMSKDQIDATFSSIDKINAAKNKMIINIFGGEPLLRGNEHVLEYILSKAAKLDCKVNILTNGTYIEGYLPMLLTYKSILNYIQVTIDGVEKLHDKYRYFRDKRGSYSLVVENTNTLIEKGFNIQVRSNLSRDGMDCFDEFIVEAERLGWLGNDQVKCYFSVMNNRHCGDIMSCVDELEYSSKLINLIENNPYMGKFNDLDSLHVLDPIMINLGYIKSRVLGPKFHYCYVNRGRSFVFGPDNRIYTCPSSTGNSDMAVGWFAPELEMDEKELLKWQFPSIDELERCNDCKVQLFCGGECAFYFHSSKSDFECGDPVNVIKTFVQKNSGLILKRVRGE